MEMSFISNEKERSNRFLSKTNRKQYPWMFVRVITVSNKVSG